MRKQARALRKAYSSERLASIEGRKYSFMVSRVAKSADCLLRDLEKGDADGQQDVIMGTSLQSANLQSPAMQAINQNEMGIASKLEETVKDASETCLIRFDGFLEELKEAISKRNSRQIDQLRKRIPSNNTCPKVKNEKVSLLEHYKELTKSSVVLDDLDKKIIGIQDENKEEGCHDEDFKILEQVDFSASQMLLDSSAKTCASQSTHRILDLSHSRSTFNTLTRNVSLEPWDDDDDGCNGEIKHEQAQAQNQPSSPMESIDISSVLYDPLEDDFLKKIVAVNHRVCMHSKSTALPISMAQVSELVRGLSPSFTLTSYDNPDPPSLLLVPLNFQAEPQWIHPDTTVQFGRNSIWLPAKSRVISRNHGEIFHDINQFYYVDVGSSTGSLINGQRLAEEGCKSEARKLQSGDILQLGITCSKRGRDEYGRMDLRYSSVQLLVILGYSKGATVPTRQQANGHKVKKEKLKEEKMINETSWKRLCSLTATLHEIPIMMPGASLRILLEISGRSGIVVACSPMDKNHHYSAIFSWGKGHGEMVVTDRQGQDVSILELMEGSVNARSYSIRNGPRHLAKLTIVSTNRIVINSITRSIPLDGNADASLMSFYTITAAPAEGRIHIIQRSPVNTLQRVVGEANIHRMKREWFSKKRKHLLEVRLSPDHPDEMLLVVGILLGSLLQLAQ